MNINHYEIILDEPVERQMKFFYVYAAVNERASERVRDALTVRCIDKRTRRSTTLNRLVESIMGTRPASNLPIERYVYDFRAISPRDWLMSLPTGISPSLDRPHLSDDDVVVRVSGKHDVKAIVVDEELPEPVYAYDTAAGFGIKFNNKSLIEFLHGPNARRKVGTSLYDFRSSAFFLVYD